MPDANHSRLKILLIALDSSVGLSILAKTIVLSGLVIIARGATAGAPSSATTFPTLSTSLMRVNLALGEFL